MLKWIMSWLCGKACPKQPVSPTNKSGTSLYEAVIYSTSIRMPARPTGGRYDFRRETLIAPIGWTATKPCGSASLWASKGLFEVKGDAGIDAHVKWSRPVIVK